MKSLYLWIWNFLGVGGPSGKILEIPVGGGGGGNNVKPSGRENLGGAQTEKPSVGGYGYFLEPHIFVPNFYSRKLKSKLHQFMIFEFKL